MANDKKIPHQNTTLAQEQYRIVHDKILNNFLYLVRKLRIYRTDLIIEAGFTKSQMSQMMKYKLKIPPKLLNFICDKYHFSIDFFYIDSFVELYKATKQIINKLNDLQ